MSATCKHDYFVRLTMGDNPVTVLPGIGRGNQKALRKEGYYKVFECLFQSTQTTAKIN